MRNAILCLLGILIFFTVAFQSCSKVQFANPDPISEEVFENSVQAPSTLPSEPPATLPQENTIDFKWSVDCLNCRNSKAKRLLTGPQDDFKSFVGIIAADANAPIHVQFEPEKEGINLAEYKCKLGFLAVVSCDQSVTLPALSPGLYRYDLKVTKGNEVQNSVFEVGVFGAYPTKDPLEMSYSSPLPTYFLKSGTLSWFPGYLDMVWMASGSVGMMLTNYCVGAGENCILVVGSGAIMNVKGTNFNSHESNHVNVYLGSSSVLIVEGSNFFPTKLHIAQGATVITWGSNWFPKQTHRLSSDFDVATCPFSRTGEGCPSHLRYISP